MAGEMFTSQSFRAENIRRVFSQGQILAVWIFAAKLPNSDLNFAVDSWVDFFDLFLPRKKAPPKNTKNSPRVLVGRIPLGFLQKPFLIFSGVGGLGVYKIWLPFC